MNSPLVFVFLFLISGAGALLGGFYYFRPEKIVMKRVKEQHIQSAKKDADFRKWLDAEIETQISRTRRMGLTILVFEAIWLVMVYGLWQKSMG